MKSCYESTRLVKNQTFSEEHPQPSCLSFRSNQSKSEPLQFKGRFCTSELDQYQFFLPRVDQQSSEVPSGPSAQQHQTQLDSIFTELERNMILFTKNELKKIQKVLNPCYPECSESQGEDEEVVEDDDEEQRRRSSTEALLKIIVFFLRKMNQEELAERLQSNVHLTFINSGVNLLEESLTEDKESALANLQQNAVDKALQSPNGHLDLFLRFLLGLSLQANQRLLQGLLTQKARSLQKNQETVQYIKQKISDNVSVDKSINLFYCLNELKDCSLQEEIRKYLKSGSLSTDKLSSAQWSALVFILLSSGKDLDEFDLKKYSASEEALLRLLPVVKAAKKAVLSGCNLSARSCEALSSVLSSQSSSLRELDLSNNDLEDSGIKQLCHGLESPCCKLETLSLSGCLVSEEGCSSLASALISNPSHLRELDLSYNHPGESGLKLLSVSQKRPDCRLDTIRAEPGSVQWLKPNFRKYFCELTLDPNTAHKFLKLSENNRKVTDLRKEHPHPDHPERFDYWPQVLCETDLTGRCYWEVEWVGKVYVAVSYRGIGRNGDSDGSKFGGNDQSWCLACTDGGYSAWHNNSGTPIPLPSSPAASHRVGVYVDCPAGILSFCRVSGDVVTHLHSFSTTFTEPLYAGFGYGVKLNSSALLCQL
ncbi:NACHT, LRR and PYD domains-containing protein 3-like [Poecilia formosa]|uniref:NACHT, LRR and PYD domains-containing protein 3-like n=1 Tax=Poecilia formosa TaxID=48698 RepID=UPI0004438C87|nr:PREDICTED: NACHT, LRR and PYD domains-containing protein 3-like [Poecilia formosa]